MSQKGQYTSTGGISGNLEKLTPDAGGFVAATGKNINLLGSTHISTVGDPGTSTINIYLTGTTDHCVQVGNISGDITSIAAGTNGQLLTGVTGGDPVFSTLTSSGGSITFTPGAGTLNIEANTAVPATEVVAGISRYATNAEAIAGAVTDAAIVPSSLDAKLGTQTLHGLPIGASSVNAIAWTAEPTNGQILIGSTGSSPALATITAGNNITVSNGAASISVAVTGTTNHAVQVGSAAGALTSLSVGTDGQVLLGATGANPAFATLTSTGGSIVFTPGANTLNLEANTGAQATEVIVGVSRYATDAEAIDGTVAQASIVPTSLKAKLGLQTQYGLPIGAGDDTAIDWTAALADGEFIIGATGATPALGTITEGDNITVTNGANSITVAVSDTTDHCVQIGNATGSLTSLAAALSGQVLVGNSGADPSWTGSPSITGTLVAGTAVHSVTLATTTLAYNTSISGKTITMGGTDADVGLTITPKGTGGLTLTSGSFTVTSGNVALTSGNVALTSGNVTLTSGNVNLTAGNVALTAGNITLPATSSTVGQITIDGNNAIHTYNGNGNVFVGTSAGNFTLTGTYAIGIGNAALNALTSGVDNTAIGGFSLYRVTSGASNTAVGHKTGDYISTGSYNTCLGFESGDSSLTTGSYNTLLGSVLGSAYTGSESSNILIGYNIAGTNGEDNTLRIGNVTGTGNGNLNKAVICGIYGKTSTSGVAVYVNSSNVLGTSTSSRDTKEDIADMGEDSSVIYNLRPRTFKFKNDVDPKPKQFGMIAEEVEEVFPEMVAYNEDGKPVNLYYQFLAPMLVNEIQKQQKIIKELMDRVTELEKRS